MAIVRDQGIVLRSYAFGEADRIIVLLSANSGKRRTVAKGVRKTKSRFGGRLESFAHVDLVLYEGRNLDTINQVSLIDAHSHIRADLDKVVAAGSMVEVVDAVSQEEESSLRMFLLLQRGLRVLDRQEGLHPDLVPSFLLKAAGVIGLAPALDECASCGSQRDLTRFSFPAGGVLCEKCRTPGAYALRPGLTEYLAEIASAELDDLPTVNPTMTSDAMGVTRRFMEYHLDQRLKSLAVLDG